MSIKDLFWKKQAAENEVFTFGTTTWHIGEAEKILTENPRGTEDIPVNALTGLLPLMRINKEHAQSADLSSPLILAVYEGHYMPIDGWHRIYRAKEEGVEALQGYLLSEEESKAIIV